MEQLHQLMFRTWISDTRIKICKNICECHSLMASISEYLTSVAPSDRKSLGI